MKKICFVGLDNYPVLNPKKGDDYFGGESVQQTLLAKAFTEMGYEVSMIVKDHGQVQAEMLYGIKVWKTFRENEGFPIVRFIYPRLTMIWKALIKADADIYYQSCAGSLTGIVAKYCKVYKRKLIFRIAHDSDCIPSELLISLWRDRKIYEYGIRRANLIAAQGVHQVELLRKNYSLESVPVNMAVELPDSDSGLDVTDPIDVLWVNNLRQFKRPELVLDVAKALPEYRFVMIGGAVRGYEGLYEGLQQQSGAIGNIDFRGAVPYQKVNDYFSRTKLFINTSDQEGFPNSFLQAWVRRTPVISFFDPDGLIASKCLGIVPGSMSEMIEAIRSVLENDHERIAMSGKAREFVLANYSPVAVAGKYEELLAAGLDR